jgi:hypothetical protein
MQRLIGVADAAAADCEQADQGLLVAEPPWESTVARIRSAPVVFCRKIPPRVAGSRSWPPRWRRYSTRPRGTPRSGRSWPGRLATHAGQAGMGTRGCQPVSPPAEFTGGLPVGVVMQRLQGHHRGYLRGRDRRPGPPPEGRTGPHNRHPERLRPGARPGTRTCCPPEPLPSQSAASRNCRPARLEPCMRNHLRPSNTKPAKGHHLAAFSARS